MVRERERESARKIKRESVFERKKRERWGKGVQNLKDAKTKINLHECVHIYIVHLK